MGIGQTISFEARWLAARFAEPAQRLPGAAMSVGIEQAAELAANTVPRPRVWRGGVVARVSRA